MKYYTLAKKIEQTYGQGNFGEEYHICPIDAYHTNNNKEFHPLFETKDQAEKYKEEISWNYNLIVVELLVFQENALKSEKV